MPKGGEIVDEGKGQKKSLFTKLERSNGFPKTA